MVGFRAERIESIDGLQIGPGGRPATRRVLYGLSEARSADVILLSAFV